jgi:hypothetical protein
MEIQLLLNTSSVRSPPNASLLGAAIDLPLRGILEVVRDRVYQPVERSNRISLQGT